MNLLLKLSMITITAASLNSCAEEKKELRSEQRSLTEEELVFGEEGFGLALRQQEVDPNAIYTGQITTQRDAMQSRGLVRFKFKIAQTANNTSETRGKELIVYACHTESCARRYAYMNLPQYTFPDKYTPQSRYLKMIVGKTYYFRLKNFDVSSARKNYIGLTKLAESNPGPVNDNAMHNALNPMDVNSDGEVNEEDLLALVKADLMSFTEAAKEDIEDLYYNDYNQMAADVNNDKVVDYEDAKKLTTHLYVLKVNHNDKKNCDTDGDGDEDANDLRKMSERMHLVNKPLSPTSAPSGLMLDSNGDGKFTAGDINRCI